MKATSARACAGLSLIVAKSKAWTSIRALGRSFFGSSTHDAQQLAGDGAHAADRRASRPRGRRARVSASTRSALLQQLAGLRQQRGADARQLDAAVGAREQRRADLALQRDDLGAQAPAWARWSRDAARVKCSSSATATK